MIGPTDLSINHWVNPEARQAMPRRESTLSEFLQSYSLHESNWVAAIIEPCVVDVVINVEPAFFDPALDKWAVPTLVISMSGVSAIEIHDPPNGDLGLPIDNVVSEPFGAGGGTHQTQFMLIAGGSFVLSHDPIVSLCVVYARDNVSSSWLPDNATEAP